jgi:ABC-type uncharacterized transport system auxiliary subunit
MTGLERGTRYLRPALAASAAAALLLSACSGKQRLGQYDFRDRSLGVVTLAPAHPEVLTGASFRIDPEQPRETLIRLGTEIAREASAYQVRSRLDAAAANVDVSGRMGERTLEHAARHLRARPVADARRADYELEVRVRRYGIVAASWTAQAHFLLDANVMLLDGPTGRRIWQRRVQARDPVRMTVVAGGDRTVTNVVSAIALASMSQAEIERALESLADFASDAVVAALVRGLDAARR